MKQLATFFGFADLVQFSCYQVTFVFLGHLDGIDMPFCELISAYSSGVGKYIPPNQDNVKHKTITEKTFKDRWSDCSDSYSRFCGDH